MGRKPADGGRRPPQQQEQRAEASGELESESPVIMEGMLKKRGANLPVMRDRYCVATWELDLALNKYVLLRSYKSRQAYDAHPERPSSVHQLKCISDWDGRTSFHRYEHAFVMETYDKKLFHCVAPSADDKAKWVDLMAIHSAFTSVARAAAPSTSRDMRLNSIGSLMPLRRASSVDSNSSAVRPRALTSGSSAPRPAAGKSRRVSDVLSTDSEGNGMGDHDGLFRSYSTDSAGSSFAPGNSGSKPFSASTSSNDWGFSLGDSLGAAHHRKEGDAAQRASVTAAATTAAMMSKMDKDQAAFEEEEEDERRRRSVMLDQELLRKAQADKNPMASDAFLFDDAGASRFGAVVVKPAADKDRDGESDSDSVDDLVDQELAQRLEREESEKQMKRRAKKLESNRDLYAEMAAARLNDMRKIARQPKKVTPRNHHSDRARFESASSTVSPSSHIAFYESDSGDEYVDDYTSGETSHEDVVSVEKRRKSSIGDQGKMSLDDLEHDADASLGDDLFVNEAVDEAVAPAPKKEKKSKKKAKSHSVSLGAMSADERKELMVGRDDEEEAVYRSDGEEQAAVSSHKKRSKHKAKRVQEEAETEESVDTEVTDVAIVPSVDPMMEAARLQEDDEERKRAKQRRKEERRAKKELQRQQEEEAAAAAAAADLARQHLETMRAREDEKRRVELEKQEKKERRDMKDRVKLEKAKQRRAEAELKKLVEMKKAEEERREQEKREREWEKRKGKRRDKYTSPTERIQKMEKHASSATETAVEASSDLSSALVVVESADAKPEAPSAALAAIPEAAASSPAVQAPSATPTPAPAPAPVPAAPAVPVAPVASEAPAVPAAPQSLPAYAAASVASPYMPGYPYMAPPPMSAPQGYPYVQYPHLPFPSAFAAPTSAPSAGYGVPIPPPYLQPHLGYVSGVPSMPTLPRTFPEAPPAVQTAEEKPVMIGPQLPEGLYPSSLARAPSSAQSSTLTLPDLPDLPDVVEF